MVVTRKYKKFRYKLLACGLTKKKANERVKIYREVGVPSRVEKIRKKYCIFVKKRKL